MIPNPIPNPGSFEATSRHRCTCDPQLNQYGAGLPGTSTTTPLFEVARGCPPHGEGSGWSWRAETREVMVRTPRVDARPKPSPALPRPASQSPMRGRPGRPPNPLADCNGCDRKQVKVNKLGECEACTQKRRYHEKHPGARRRRLAGV